jgi:alpha-tubulin suppressor-like RCC1 family protein
VSRLARRLAALLAAVLSPALLAAEIPTDRVIVRLKVAPAAQKRATDAVSIARKVAARSGEALRPLRAMGDGSLVMALPKRMPPSVIRARFHGMGDEEVLEVLPDRLFVPAATPTDPQYASQWYLSAANGINAPAAWDINTGASDLVVAIVDTGKLPHEELAGRWVGGHDFVDDVNRSNDGDGRDADASDPGDWVTSAEAASGPLAGCPVTDSRWHGTAMAGVIGAAANNGVGIAGVNWSSKLLPVRVVGKCGAYESDIADGIRWAAGVTVSGVPANPNPAHVVNLSLSTPGSCSGALQSAIDDVVAAGAPIVVAAGNDSLSAANYSPGNCSGVITVGAVDANGGKPTYTNFGDALALSAPAGITTIVTGTPEENWVLTTQNTGTTTPSGDNAHYQAVNGTSIATALVAGAASLVRSVRPTLGPQYVKQILQNTARAFPTGTTGLGSQADCTAALCGRGIVDVARAVQAAQAWGTATAAAAIGDHMGVGLRIDGTVWTWGTSNNPGGPQKWQLGRSGGPAPAQVTDIAGVTQVATGNAFVLALRSDGSVWSWGVNNLGQLGIGLQSDNDSAFRDRPVQVLNLDSVVAISAGGYHAVALKADGTVWTWGDGYWGQLGNGTAGAGNVPLYATVPVQVSGLTGVTAISAARGGQHTLALKSDGTVWAWGVNTSRQIGDGGGGDVRATAVQVSGLAGVASIAAGGAHSLALKGDGTLWAWGYGDFGQLGNGAAGTHTTPVQATTVAGPIAGIAAGGLHTLVLLADGTVKAFGFNTHGALGDGTNTHRFTPVSVTGLSNVVQLGGAYNNSIALESDGTVWAWGNNTSQQLGDGTTTTRNVPVRVLGLGGGGYLDLNATGTDAFAAQQDVPRNSERTSNTVSFIGIAAGSNVSITGGQYSVNGAAFTAGIGSIDPGDTVTLKLMSSADFATPTTATFTVAGVDYPFSVTTLAGDETPDAFGYAVQWNVPLASIRNAEQVTVTGLTVPVNVSVAGGEFSIGCTGTYATATASINNGQALCLRQTAAATPNTLTAATITVGTFSTSFTVITASDATFTTAPQVDMGGWMGVGLRIDGTVWTWGVGEDGGGWGLGRPGGPSPAQVTIAGITKVAAGNSFVVALRSDGSVWSWGVNNLGQLGDGTTTARAGPVQVSGLAGVTAIAAGGFHAVALKSDGTVWVWGNGYQGQLGNGTAGAGNVPLFSTTPVQVSGLAGVTAIAAGGAGHHTLALKSDGTVWGWGLASEGQIGDGAQVPAVRAVPVQVSGLANVSAISAGGAHSLALRGDGTVWAWGYNDYGQVGDGSTTWRLAPVQVASLSGVAALAAGGLHSMALMNDGTVRAWGFNGQNAIGDGTSTNRLLPVTVTGLGGLVQLDAAYHTSVALRSDGTVWAWGNNDARQLGDGTTIRRSTPVRTLGANGAAYLDLDATNVDAFAAQLDVPRNSERTSNLVTFIGIAPASSVSIAGGLYSVNAAPHTTGIGSIGPGDTVTLRQTSSSSYGATTIATFTVAGVDYPFAVTTLAGDDTPDAFGYAVQWNVPLASVRTAEQVSVTGITVPATVSVAGGEFSIGCTGTYTSIPADINNGQALCLRQTASATPNTMTVATITVGTFSAAFKVVTADDATFSTPAQASVGDWMGVGLRTDGTVWTWGTGRPGNDNFFGGLGRTGGPAPGQVTITGVTKIATGNDFVLALRHDGTVWGWGFNQFGQLGDGTTVGRAIPVQVGGLADVVAISAGGYHGVALKADGTVWTWGNSDTGQLGNGTVSPGGGVAAFSTVPVQASGLTGVIAIAAGNGGLHTLALRTDGTVWGWGQNSTRQIENTGGDVRPLPIQVAGLSGVTAIAAGGAHSLALKADGTLWGLGHNDFGQLGNGSTAFASPLVQVQGLVGTVAAIAAGGLHSMALMSDGTVRAWGFNTHGVIGDGTTITRTLPVTVTGLANVVQLDAAYNVSMALKADGSVWAWGNNNSQHLGDGTATQRNSPVRVLGAGGGPYLDLDATNTDAFAAQQDVPRNSERTSNPVTFIGIAPASSVSIAGGLYSVNGGAYTTGVGSIGPGDTVTLKQTSSPDFGTTTTATFTVAGVDYPFHVTTLAGDETPDAFSYAVQWNVPLASMRNAEQVTIAGLTVPVDVSVAGGEFSIGCTGSYTATTASIANGQTLCLRQNAAATPNTMTTATITVGTFSAAFKVVTPTDATFTTTAQVAIGANAAVGLRVDGTVWTWGRSSNPGGTPKWELGRSGGPAPGQVTIAGVTKVAMSHNFVLALRSDGTVWSWGWNDFGQLGIGLQSSGGPSNAWRDHPVQVSNLTGVVAISAGAWHAVALKADGTVWTWGDGYMGQLGNGTAGAGNVPLFSTVPLQVPGLADVVAISASAGQHFTLALKSNGTVWAWGLNNTRQIGDGAGGDVRAIPAQVSGLTGVNAISAGGSHSLALKGDGSVWAWGYNDYGQVGNGATGFSVAVPVPVSGLAGTVSTVAAGGLASYALMSDGTVRAWGYNGNGQIGDGSTTNRLAPVTVTGLGNVVQLAGSYVSTLALKNDGSVWGWGHNGAEQLGDGTTTSRSIPVRVQGANDTTFTLNPSNTIPDPFAFTPRYFIPLGAQVESNPVRLTGIFAPSPISITGGEYSINGGAFTSANGTALDNDVLVVRVVAAPTVETTTSATLFAGGPAGVSATFFVRTRKDPSVTRIPAAVAAGDSHTFMLTTDGVVHGTGYNGNGQLGNGTTLGLSAMRPIGGPPGLVAIASGAFHALALRSDGTVAGWGSNIAGQVGSGSGRVAEVYPVGVPGLSTVVEISTGGYHSLALLNDGSVRAWGLNTEGQVGDGTTAATRALPVAVALSGVRAIAAGGRHSLALLDDGTVRAWGANEAGQLGDGSTTQRNAPVAVSGLANVVAIAAGDAHSLAIKSDGSVVAWGFNGFGQLGDGTTANRLTPVAVPALGTGVGLVAAGANHSLAVKAAGVMYAWGNNANSQLGTGDNANRSTPQVLATPSAVVAISGGARHTGAITAARRLFIWGDNFFGQAGNRSGNYNPHSASLNVLRGDSVISTGAASSGGGVGTGSNSGSSVLEIDNQQTGFDFGSMAQGTSRAIGGRFKNASATEQVTGVGVAVTGAAFGLSGNTCPGALAVSQECTFDVAFNPPGAGTFAGELVVQSSVVGAPERRSLIGTSVPPATAAIRFATEGLDFPPQVVGQPTAAGAYAVTNSGSSNLTVASVASNLQDFSATHDCVNVAPNASCNLQVTFVPMAPNARIALLTIASNASGSPHNVPVSGTGVATTAPPANFLLTVVRAGNGAGAVTSTSPASPSINCGASCSATYDAGTLVTLQATPSPGSVFSGWSGACTGAGSCTVAITAALSVTAAFTPTYALTVGKAGDGAGTVASTDPAGVIACGAACSAVFNEGEVVTLVATPGAGSTFTGWSGACLGTSTCQVTMSQARSVTATFGLATYPLTVTRAGAGTGTVASTVPIGIIDCGALCSANVNTGTSVTLAATPTGNSTFAGWSGACTGAGSCTVTMTQARSVTATFVPPGSYALTVVKAGTGTGTVASTSPASPSIDCGSNCAATYVDGTSVTLAATPSNGSVFAGWSGACTGTGSCVVSMTQARTVTATFDAPPTFALTVAKSGSGSGTVASSPAGTIDCGATCSANVASGTIITLLATPSAGSVFAGWSGACTGAGNCIVTMNQARSVTANFVATYVLTVAKAGDGSGTVTSTTPAGLIDCGASCSAAFNDGTVVTLVATPASGSAFTGWSGACTGAGSCQVTMSATRAVTATFTLASPPRLGNISTRGNVLTGNDVMIGGFVIGGSTTKRVAIVATGPSLSAFGIINPLANPTLTLVRSSDQAVLATNDNWQSASNQADLTAAGFAPSNPLEAAILVDLPPGAYTAIVQGAGNGTGVSVVGVYEVTGPEIPLINISTRGRVGTGNDVMIGGFVIQGSGPQTVAIVATGPSLANFGITSPLANPTLTVVRSSDQAVVASNDDWQGHANASQLQAAGFAPSNALESGIFITLQPGAYTAIVSGVGGGTGIGVIGVYRVN